METGECRQTLKGHPGDVMSVGITPDGRTAISGSCDQTVRYGVRCVVWLRWGGYHVMWRRRAVGMWFVILSCVRYWCITTTDLWNVCVICRSVVVCRVVVVCSCLVICRVGECYIECHCTCVVVWYFGLDCRD